MRRRFIGLVASVVLAALGTVVLVSYVQSAHDKAAAGEPTLDVLVVTKTIPRGTKASDLASDVTLKHVPANTKLDSAVSSIGALKGKVASTDLLVGEQVLSKRFQTLDALGRQGVPKGLLEVTVRLAPERAMGGDLKAGDTVAVVSSFAPFELDAAGEASDSGPKKTPNTTHVILHKVLVTNVQTTDAAKKSEQKVSDQKTVQQAPAGELLITLAVDATSVQRVVFTAEYGALYLSAEPSDAPDGQTRIETRATVG